MRFSRGGIGSLAIAAWLITLMLATSAWGQVPQEDLVVIGGSVRSQDSDEPIAGVTVITCSHTRRDGMREIGEPVRTDENGRWTVPVPRPVRGENVIYFRLLSRKFGSVRTEEVEAVAGNALELAPIPLARGILLRGRIVNVDDAAAPILEPRFEALDGLPLEMDVYADSPAKLSIGPEGVFEMPWAVVPGKWAFRSKSHVPVEEPFRLSLKRPVSSLEVRVSVGRLLTIKGQVVDQSDRPLAGARVTVKRGGAMFEIGSYNSVTSDESGRFHIERRFAPRDSVDGWRLGSYLQYYNQVTPSNFIDQPVKWPNESVRVVMTTEPMITLRAKRADTGEALNTFSVHCCFWHEGSKQASVRPIRGAQVTEGFVRVQNRRGWSNRILLVRSDDPALAPSGIKLVRTTEQVNELTFTLGPARMRTVMVRDTAGLPIRGAQVVAWLRGNAGLGKVMTVSGDMLGLEPEVNMMLMRGTTNASGQFQFQF